MKQDRLLARKVLAAEARSVHELMRSVNRDFERALDLMEHCLGRIVVTGMGKPGFIARKIAATMSSTGTVATFLHPSDGMHGDLGVMTADDVVIAIGKSGESEELVRLLPAIKRLGAKVIAITSRRDSTLAREADVVLFAPIAKEACPLDLAPTASTTVALAIGDALAIALMKWKNFKSEDFARYHPGGKLGKRLLLKTSDLMIPKARCPILPLQGSSIQDAILSLSEYGVGIVLFCSDGDRLEGILTDGDIRQLLVRDKTGIFNLRIEEVINRKPHSLPPDLLAVEALKFMEDRPKPLNVVPILQVGCVAGVLRLHELLSVS